MPKLLVSTIASGKATFGPYVGTKDIAMMHSIVDLQGLNFVTRRILDNAAGAICGMVGTLEEEETKPRGVPVALSMLGTTTPGALRVKEDPGGEGFRGGRVSPERDRRHRHGGHDPGGRFQGRSGLESP